MEGSKLFHQFSRDQIPASPINIRITSYENVGVKSEFSVAPNPSPSQTPSSLSPSGPSDRLVGAMATEEERSALLDVFLNFCGPENADKGQVRHKCLKQPKMSLTQQVWRGDDDTLLQTLLGHTNSVFSLAVGLDGKIYSGSRDTTIRVWSGDDGSHLRSLVGHTAVVYSLAVELAHTNHPEILLPALLWPCSQSMVGVCHG